MKYLWVGLLLWWAAAPQVGWAQSASPVGVWVDDVAESHIEIYRCGEKLCGRIVWLNQSQDSVTGRPKTDLRNPDPEKRSRPLLNLVVVQNLTYNASDDLWDGGEIYDPHNGHTYSCFLRLDRQDRLEIKGYIGFPMIGRSHYWSRVAK
ncbi:DUF2147 domain-containing protein [Hymenobacter jejuensis]|uniref:DUF2147 domain-containing protein n=1 Tax=Hymenobacter jejuensis TaxID=2502781 RepID=A0A5B8A5Y4_9BACT|nr:DUF2147 domain-containing protein [Hymenobacter jejuensis]QDA62113.1 DUF2147 domain-containing protein [Hymenobacter jejuensis]